MDWIYELHFWGMHIQTQLSFDPITAHVMSKTSRMKPIRVFSTQLAMPHISEVTSPVATYSYQIFDSPPIWNLLKWYISILCSFTPVFNLSSISKLRCHYFLSRKKKMIGNVSHWCLLMEPKLWSIRALLSIYTVVDTQIIGPADGLIIRDSLH